MDTEIYSPGEGRVVVSACPHPFRAERRRISLPAGLSIAEMLEAVQADPLLRRHAVIFVGDQQVPREVWHRLRPKPGAQVAIRVVPSGGDSKVLRTVLLIAVAAAAFFVPGALSLEAGSLGAFAVATGIGVAGCPSSEELGQMGA